VNNTVRSTKSTVADFVSLFRATLWFSFHLSQYAW